MHRTAEKALRTSSAQPTKLAALAAAITALMLVSGSIPPARAVELLAAPSKPSDVDIKVQVAISKSSIPTGGEGEAVVTLTPPTGVHLNRYPPIRLTVEPNPPVSFPQTSLKVGLDAMPKNMEDNAFQTVDPIHVKFKVGHHGSDGPIPIKGKLRYTYCVVRSGFCAPGAKDISFSVPVSAQP